VEVSYILGKREVGQKTRGPFSEKDLGTSSDRYLVFWGQPREQWKKRQAGKGS